MKFESEKEMSIKFKEFILEEFGNNIEIIEEFKEWVKNRKEKVIGEYKILTVDHSYEKKTCIVTCKVKYKKPTLYRTYFYIYNLHQEGIKWILDDIDVINYSKEK